MRSPTVAPSRAVVFIGSSSQGMAVAKQLSRAISSVLECRLWSEGVFVLSRGTLENLIDATKQSDFAILVLTPDDLVLKKGRKAYLPRDNVIFEIGLFMGAIGRHRTFIVHGSADVIDLPSDLAGITTATYSVGERTGRPDMRTVCKAVQREIRRSGRRVEESSGAMLDLLGEWKCLWTADGESPIRDAVCFTRVVDEHMYAVGVNERFGNYDLSGRMSHGGVLTVSYRGDARRQFSGGVVILKLHTNSRTEMTGYWYEFDADREIYGGKTHWEKLKSGKTPSTPATARDRGPNHKQQK